jgi:hypothetical protein
VFTRVLHWSLSWARSIQKIPPGLVSPRFSPILLLSTHLSLGLSNGLFLSGFRTSFLPIHAIWPVHLILLDLTNLIIIDEECKLFSSPLWSVLQCYRTNILRNISTRPHGATSQKVLALIVITLRTTDLVWNPSVFLRTPVHTSTGYLIIYWVSLRNSNFHSFHPYSSPCYVLSSVTSRPTFKSISHEYDAKIVNPHGATSQKTAFFIVTTVNISNPTEIYLMVHLIVFQQRIIMITVIIYIVFSTSAASVV